MIPRRYRRERLDRMKEIAAVVLLLAAVLWIYQGTVGGDDGMESRVKNGGGRVHTAVERLNP